MPEEEEAKAAAGDQPRDEFENDDSSGADVSQLARTSEQRTGNVT